MITEDQVRAALSTVIDPLLVKETKRAINRQFEIMGLTEQCYCPLCYHPWIL